MLVDLPGHGRYANDPDAGAFTLDATLELVKRAGRWPADLIGYSLGGRIALHFAAAQGDRVRRLVLESASPGLASDAERVERRVSDEALAHEIETKGVERFVAGWQDLPLFESQKRLDSATLQRVRAGRLSNTAAGLAGALRGLGTGALPPLWEALPAIEVPTLIVTGSVDEKFVDIGERMAATLPNATLVVVRDAGHAVHVERPDAWLEVVTDFLR